ncbi:MAG: ferrous iron transport protein A [Phycisphaerae bacterium]|nr:ferrous iron transport protein A [Phycisphaerae bacterium]
MEKHQVQDKKTTDSVSLRSLRAGDAGLVTALRDSSSAARRLAEFGVIRGTTLEVLRAGAPCIVRVDHTRLSLGASLQDGILLSPLG